MTWKNNVVIEQDDGLWIRCGAEKKQVKKEDEDIVLLMGRGITDDDELIKKVAEQTDGDDISSGFKLAQFVEDYGDFLAEGVRATVFGAMV